MCVGYPVLKQKVEFKRGGRCANKGDWTKFVMNTKVRITNSQKKEKSFLSLSLHRHLKMKSAWMLFIL